MHGGADHLYPWRLTGQGIVVDPWPVIRGEWHVAPTLHPWDTILVVHRGADGRLAVLPEWPEAVLPPLPPGRGTRPRDGSGRARRVIGSGRSLPQGGRGDAAWGTRAGRRDG